MRFDLLLAFRSPWRFGLLVASVYLCLGGFWVYFSDALLADMVQDDALRAVLQTAKGLFFIALNGVLLGGLATVVLRQQHALKVRLSRKEADYRTLFRESPFPLFAEDCGSGDLLAVNDAACEMYGYDYGEWLLRRFADLGAAEVDGHLMHVHRSGRLMEVEVISRSIRFGGRRALLHHVRDLTAQRSAEVALATSEARLRLCIRATGLGVWDYLLPRGEPEGGSGQVVVSAEYAQMLGYDPLNFVETPARWVARLHPADRAWVRASFGRYIDGDEDAYRVEFRMAHQDGGYRWLRSVGLIVERDAEGQPLRVIGSHQDITGEVHTAGRIEALTRLYEALSHTSQAIVYARDAGELFARVCRIAVVQGRMGLAWVSRIDSAGGANPVQVCHGADMPLAMRLAHALQQEGDLLARLVRDGEVIISPCSGPGASRSRALLPLRAGGRTVALAALYSAGGDLFTGEMESLLKEMAAELSFALDRFALQCARDEVEARLRDSEARFRLYLERLPIGCMVIDLRNRILAANPALELLFGYTPGSLEGCSALNTLISAEAEPQFRLMLSRLRDGALDAHGVTEHRTRDGRSIVCEWFNTPLRGSDGGVEAGLFMVMDVTARVADQARLADTHRELADLSARLLTVQEEERRLLSRELHDEVGQQLAALRLNLAALRGRSLPGDGSARVGDCLSIVEETLRRIRDRALNLRPAILDDLGLAPALEWYCQAQAVRAGIPVKLVLPPARRYREALEIAAFRIVQEAVRNALQHGSPARVEVRVQERDGSLMLRVDDDGVGISGTEVNPGRLGLVSMRERAGLVGGSLVVESPSGHGTRIRAILPLELPAPGL